MVNLSFPCYRKKSDIGAPPRACPLIGYLMKGPMDRLKLRFQQGVERVDPSQEDKEQSCE
jgi:hypothetical protein